jgi:hypothetical protein
VISCSTKCCWPTTPRIPTANDAGDTVTFNAGAITVVASTFGTSTLNKSFNLDPDIIGVAYALHDAIAGHLGAYSPGKKNDGTVF